MPRTKARQIGVLAESSQRMILRSRMDTISALGDGALGQRYRDWDEELELPQCLHEQDEGAEPRIVSEWIEGGL
jgi:hypothetical protein